MSDYQAVVELQRENPDVPRIKAFEQIARERGKTAGAVAGNFYRIRKEFVRDHSNGVETNIPALIAEARERLDKIEAAYQEIQGMAQVAERIREAIAA